MTQNEKELLLRDLCARLPYGVMAKFGDSNPSKITNITQGIDSNSWFVESESEYDGEYDGMMCEINNVKPYLFPLSSMTEEQDKEFALLQTSPGQEGFLYIWNCANMMKWLIENNFDYNGLIPKGLAIDATGLNIY